MVSLDGGLSGHAQNLSAIVETFMMSVDAMDTTRATYRKVMYLFMDWITETGRTINTLDSTDVIAYKDALLTQGKSAPTVNLYLSVLRKFYKWTKSSNLYPNITDGVGSVKTRRNVFRKQHLESEEGARLLEHSAEAKKVHGKSGTHTRRLNATEEQIARRNHAMINLMLRTGLRTIEVSRADVGDICRRKGRRILKVWGKGHAEKDDFVVLTDEAYAPSGTTLRHVRVPVPKNLCSHAKGSTARDEGCPREGYRRYARRNSAPSVWTVTSTRHIR